MPSRAPPGPSAVIEFAGCRRENVEMADVLQPLVTRVLADGRMLQGPEVAVFEGQLAEACNRRHAVAVGSGTDALFLALAALGLGPGDEVLVPDVSFIATAAAVARTGARPVFVDVDDGCLIDIARCEAAVTPRTRAIVVVQLFGAMVDPAPVNAFAGSRALAVVEDAAQAFGASFAGLRAGSLGKVSAVSFDPTKVLSAPGSGGAVLMDDAGLAARVRRLRYHGREDGRYVEPGYNSQLPTLAAAILSAKLERQEVWLRRRQAIAEAYSDALAPLPVEPVAVRPEVRHAWHKYVIRCASRDALAAHLAARGVPTLVHYPRPFHAEPMFGASPDAAFPNANAHAAAALSLPIHAHLSDAEVARIIQSLQDFFHDG